MSRIAARRLERKAFVYVRQSSPAQVQPHRESTQRAVRPAGTSGDPGMEDAEQVETIEEDQGQSGASAVNRGGFQRLVSRGGIGACGGRCWGSM